MRSRTRGDQLGLLAIGGERGEQVASAAPVSSVLTSSAQHASQARVGVLPVDRSAMPARFGSTASGWIAPSLP